jgi:hypothetical protein
MTGQIKHICVFLTIFFLCSCTNNKKDNGNLSASAVDTASSSLKEISVNNDNDGTTGLYTFKFSDGT